MASKKKLQVFVSSTYLDLKAERQAAVAAILAAGHIPAGMELFTAGDESQMAVIKRWIEQSDVYMLILGGRYGSIDKKSKKSFTHLEYEYALSRNKPYFAVVIEDAHLEAKVKSEGLNVIEMENSEKLGKFRTLVLSSICRQWKSLDEIKLAVHESLANFADREELHGWVPGNEAVNTGPLAEELARLSRKNEELRDKIAIMEKQLSPPKTTDSFLFKVDGKPITQETEDGTGIYRMQEGQSRYFFSILNSADQSVTKNQFIISIVYEGNRSNFDFDGLRIISQNAEFSAKSDIRELRMIIVPNSTIFPKDEIKLIMDFKDTYSYRFDTTVLRIRIAADRGVREYLILPPEHF